MFTRRALLALLCLPATVAGQAIPGGRSESPWWINQTGYTLRPGLSAYGNPYYSLPTGPPPRGMSPLVGRRMLTLDELTVGRSPIPPAPPRDLLADGRLAFFSRAYPEAVERWRGALAANPGDGTLQLLLAQAHFQEGQFEESAACVRLGLLTLPPERWGTVVRNVDLLYRETREYQKQLTELEKAVAARPTPGLRLLLAYHWLFQGRQREGLEQLQQALEAAPRDAGLKELRQRWPTLH